MSKHVKENCLCMQEDKPILWLMYLSINIIIMLFKTCRFYQTNLLMWVKMPIVFRTVSELNPIFFPWFTVSNSFHSQLLKHFQYPPKCLVRNYIHPKCVADFIKIFIYFTGINVILIWGIVLKECWMSTS